MGITGSQGHGTDMVELVLGIAVALGILMAQKTWAETTATVGEGECQRDSSIAW